jgi:beta-glucosidase/6-phospho-beta-glucosidase/beta-galactosidase
MRIERDAMSTTPLELLTGFESTYLPRHDRDVVETTEHDIRRHSDLSLLRACGVRRVRYPIRWQRTEREPRVYDWSDTDAALDALAAHGVEPIVDLVHHTSYPRWLTAGFSDARFHDAYLEYCLRFAERYPDTRAYTLFNEPLATLFLCGHEAIWPPYEEGIEKFVAVLANVLPAFAAAAAMYAELLPHAEHVYVDTCEHHDSDGTEWAAGHAHMANTRRFFVLDALLGRATGEDAFGREVLEHGGDALFDLPPARVDVLGIDYYAHGEWWYSRNGGTTPSPEPLGLAAVATQYSDRYGMRMMLSETNIRGHASDRATWLKYTLEQCEALRESGVPLESYCWFPFVDSCDWNSLLYRCDACVDPVGVVRLDERMDRRLSTMTLSFARAAAGTPASELPAYRYRPPVSRWLHGWAPQTAHWEWLDPPDDELVVADPHDTEMELRVHERTA